MKIDEEKNAEKLLFSFEFRTIHNNKFRREEERIYKQDVLEFGFNCKDFQQI